MSGPTLRQMGGLNATIWSEPQAVLDKYVPIQYIMTWFKNKLKKVSSPADRILILRSATGSGKSTAFPAELYYVFYEEMKRGIACLQPKVALAKQIPVDSVIPFYTKEDLRKSGHGAKEPMELGVNIGYQTSAFSTVPVKGLTYMTIGTLTQQLAIMPDEDFMNKYGFIIVDEAHERSVDTDMVLYALKRLVERNYKNPLCPFVIVTSATFDVIHFCDYMLSSVKSPERYQNIIDVKGSTTFPIEEIFLPYDAKNYIQTVVDTVAKIHIDYAEDFLGPKTDEKKVKKLSEDEAKAFAKATFYRDILIFVSGSSDIRDIKKGIDALNSENEFFKQYPVIALKLSGKEVGEETEEFINIFNRTIDQLNVEVHSGKAIQIKKPFRRVMIATNVAETGLTFSSLKYVIDTGFRKTSEYNPTFNMDALVLQPITKGIHTQRKGRVGRRAPGFSFPMFTEKSHNELLTDNLPAMLLEEMTLQILKMIVMDVDPKNTVNNNTPAELFSEDPEYVEKLRYEIKALRTDLRKQIKDAKINVAKFDLLDLPSADSIHDSLEKLYILGAINSNMQPTALGFVIMKFRFIPIESIKMILSGFAWGASIADLITIAAFLDFQNDLRPRKMEKKRAKAAALNRGHFGLSDDASTKILGYSELAKTLEIADDFINNLLLYFDFQQQVNKIFSGENDAKQLDNMEAWCAELGVDYNTIINAIERRDEIINTMAAIGFNPFENDSASLLHVVQSYQNASRDELLECVCKIKQCIYEGYKLNMAEWNPKAKAYITKQTHTFLPFFNPLFIGKRDIDKYGDGNPRFIIFDKITLKLNQNTGLYTPNVNGISVLDGFVAIDQHAF